MICTTHKVGSVHLRMEQYTMPFRTSGGPNATRALHSPGGWKMAHRVNASSSCRIAFTRATTRSWENKRAVGEVR